MLYKTIIDKIALKQVPLEWDWICFYCGVEATNYYDFYLNFEPKLYPKHITFNVYCKKCRDTFDTFVEDKNMMRPETPYEKWVHRCSRCLGLLKT